MVGALPGRALVCALATLTAILATCAVGSPHLLESAEKRQAHVKQRRQFTRMACQG